MPNNPNDTFDDMDILEWWAEKAESVECEECEQEFNAWDLLDTSEVTHFHADVEDIEINVRWVCPTCEQDYLDKVS